MLPSGRNRGNKRTYTHTHTGQGFFDHNYGREGSRDELFSVEDPHHRGGVLYSQVFIYFEIKILRKSRKSDFFFVQF